MSLTGVVYIREHVQTSKRLRERISVSVCVVTVTLSFQFFNFKLFKAMSFLISFSSPFFVFFLWFPVRPEVCR